MYRYLANFRGCNVGPLMGREIRPGEYALALDVDTRHRGAESLRRPLKGRRIRPPRTATARTGGGGWHVLLTSPFPARSKTGAFGPDYPGLDLKGVGGYIVAAPSIHPITGHAYRWIRHPYQGIAPAPKRFLAGRVGEAGIGVRRPPDDVQFAVRLPRPGGALMPARPAAASPSMRKSNDARSTAPNASDCSSCSNAG